MKHICDENGCRIVYDDEEIEALKKNQKNALKKEKNNKK